MSAEDRDQISLFGDNAAYDQFKEKFTPKKTADDCYTPPNVYNAVAEWVCREYGVERERFVRPFWPHTDYLTYQYPEGCIVVDNPPFSIRTGIAAFFVSRGIRFFLFSPALSLLCKVLEGRVCHIATGVSITYDNGAAVPTSFITNMENCAMRTAPELYRAVKSANQDNLKAMKKQMPKYQYPDACLTAATMQRFCHYGIDLRIEWPDCRIINGLDAQKPEGKSIFGGGLLLAERAAAERAAPTRWQLSPRELAMQRELGRTEG